MSALFKPQERGYDAQRAQLATSPQTETDGDPETDTLQKEMGDHMLSLMGQVNDDTLQVYYRTSVPAPLNRLPPRQRRMGYANGTLFHQPIERGSSDANRYVFHKRAGASASAALKSWLSGPTIADCRTTLIAIQLDAVRAALGDARFDELYDDWKGPLISPHEAATPLAQVMSDTAAKSGSRGAVGARDVTVGERHYFANHPDYIYKHPEGLWSGENVIYAGDASGEQTWVGFGAEETEADMLDLLREQYNNPRTSADYEWIVRNYLPQLIPTDGDWKRSFTAGESQLRRSDEGKYYTTSRLAAPLGSNQDLMAAGGGLRFDESWKVDAAKVMRLRKK